MANGLGAHPTSKSGLLLNWQALLIHRDDSAVAIVLQVVQPCFMQKIQPDKWGPLSITSIFSVPIVDGRPGCVGKGRQTTDICGLGWRFEIEGDDTVIDFDTAFGKTRFSLGQTRKTSFGLYFQPHLISSASFGELRITVHSNDFTKDNLLLHWTQHTRPNTPSTTLTLPNVHGKPALIGSFTFYGPKFLRPLYLNIEVSFSPQLGFRLPKVISVPLKSAVNDTVVGKEFADIQFYLFSRRAGHGTPTEPKALFANQAMLLDESSPKLNTLLRHSGFGKSDIGKGMPEMDGDAYDYDSDSDLDSDSECSTTEAPSPVGSTTTVPNNTSSGNEETSDDAATVAEKPEDDALEVVSAKGAMIKHEYLSRGMVRMPINDFAYKTWKCFILYQYNKELTFLPLKSQQEEPSSLPSIPACSPKSMYRLAEKYGLRALEEICLQAIKTRISCANVVEELFTLFTHRYSKVQEMEIAYLCANFQSEQVARALDRKVELIAGGAVPHGAATMKALLESLRKSH